MRGHYRDSPPGMELHERLSRHTGLEVREAVRQGRQGSFRVTAIEDGRPRRFVLRGDAPQSPPGSISCEVEFHVIAAAVEVGTPTPRARFPGEGLVRDGAFAYLADWVDGEVTGSSVVSHPARDELPEQLARALSAIHRITPETHELPLSGRERDPGEAALEAARELLDALPEPHAGLELAYVWATEHVPEPGPITLVHGDFRTGNFVVGEGGLAAVLDWEFAHWGDPLEDIGRLCVRSWRFGQVALPAGGLATRARFYPAYGELSGHDIDPEVIHFWEVLGNLRRGATHLGERCQVAFEALRLIELGPPEL